jgi:AcrR family transcriptional regulator
MGRPKNFDRTEVLEKAMPLFWRRGFADTGMQDLEKATGVNKSGLYAEFKDKQDLFLESLRHYAATRKGRDLLAVEPLGWGNLEAYLKFKLARKDGMNGCFAVNTMRETELLPDEARDILAESRGNLKKLFLQNIAAGKAANAPKAAQSGLTPEALTEMLSTWFSGFCIEQNVSGDAKAKPAKSAARKVEDFLAALRAL